MGAFVQELFRFDLYKRSQGKIARQVTFAALALIIVLAAWCLNDFYENRVGSGNFSKYVVPLTLLVGGLWVSFRAVQMPSFADFLISVEAEMNKVSWPTWTELIRSSIVVILMIFILATVLFFYDFAWKFLLERVLHLK
ncbi:MAG: preprotein translocase subunit SecE [Pirellulales bacterium]